MFPGLNSLLDCSENNLPRGKFILLSESQNDASFLIHHYLSLFLKGGNHVCFLALTQSFTHYSCVAQKLGNNLLTAQEKGHLAFIDGLRLLSNAALNPVSSDENEEPHTLENPFKNLGSPSFSLKHLYHFIKVHMRQSPNGSPWVLIIDDVSLLLSLGVPVLEVVKLIHYCQIFLCENTSESSAHSGNVVCLVKADDDGEDEEAVLLKNNLLHKADTNLHVVGLSTGYCRDVHGQLTITSRDPAQISQFTPESKTVQFKILDKTVSFFAPGTSAAVL